MEVGIESPGVEATLCQYGTLSSTPATYRLLEVAGHRAQHV